MRERREYITSFAPPPSPIPTAKGHRSAAADDGSLIEFFSSNLHIPYLRLPDQHHAAAPTTSYRPKLPAQIDFRLLVSGVGNSIDRLIRSAKEFGVVRIVGHGIARDEIVAAKAVVEVFFGRLDDRKMRWRRSFVERVGNREEFVWFRSDKAMVLWAREVMGPDRYRDFSYRMEGVVSKLDAIAEELAELFTRNAPKRFGKVIEEQESIISLYRYNDMSPSLLVSSEDIQESYDHALGLHLAMERGEFYVHTDKGPLSFSTDPNTIIVTVGDQLAEWSSRDFKSVTGELIFDPDLHEMEASYSLELKCSPLSLNAGYRKKDNKKLSISDQVLIVFVISFLYRIVFFMFGRIAGTRTHSI
ncbi:hypothetical protein Drorol1_Dr00026419 [Drosera rotundifolia]